MPLPTEDVTTQPPALRTPSMAFTLDIVRTAGDDSYPTGGTPDFQAWVRQRLQRQVTVMAVVGQECGGYQPVYDLENDTLFVRTSGGSEVSNGTDLSGTTFNLVIHGR